MTEDVAATTAAATTAVSPPQEKTDAELRRQLVQVLDAINKLLFSFSTSRYGLEERLSPGRHARLRRLNLMHRECQNFLAESRKMSKKRKFEVETFCQSFKTDF